MVWLSVLLIPQPPVQNIVLQVGDEGHEEGRAHEPRDGGPSVGEPRSVGAPEEVVPDDAGEVGTHRHDGHRDRSLFGRLGVERDPRAVDGICNRYKLIRLPFNIHTWG